METTTAMSHSDIQNRFFTALDMMVEQHRIRGYQTFTRKHGVCRTNLNIMMRNPNSLALRPEYLAWLCEDFGFSARWLLLGQGEIFDIEEQERQMERRAEGIAKAGKRSEIVAQIKELAAKL